MKKFILLFCFTSLSLFSYSQINTDRVMRIGRNALYFEDYILAIQYFNQVIRVKPQMADPYFYRAAAKLALQDYKGAEDDCTLALENNPFMLRGYQLRGDARQSQNNLDGALKDYKAAQIEAPTDKFILINIGIVNTQKKNFEDAEKSFNELLQIYPKYAAGYITRGAMYQEKGDTTLAFENYDKAIELDKYLPTPYSMRGLLYYYKQEYDSALIDLDEAIKLDPLITGNYVNRGLIKYAKSDLRGAMKDYDEVIRLETSNVIARFNRGLLRAQVGDNNNAIADFNVVLEYEPDNYMAYFNRALLRQKIKDYNGALSDLKVVMTEYPDFYQGYYLRSEIKKEKNDLKGAEHDYNIARSEQSRIQKEWAASLATGKNPSDKEGKEKTREKSDRNINKFNLLVVSDKAEEEKSKYNNDLRGKIQNRQVRINPESRFVITYYEKQNDIRNRVYYSSLIDEMNRLQTLSQKIRLTNSEVALDESQIKDHFDSMNNVSKSIVDNPNDANLYFTRALDYMLTQDFTSSLADFKKSIDINPNFSLAYFNQAVVYEKIIELKEKTETENDLTHSNTNKLSLPIIKISKDDKSTIPSSQLPTNTPIVKELKSINLEYDMAIRNYNKVIEINPDFVYAYYNRAGIRFKLLDYKSAILDYNEAIRRNNNFTEAYFNRGLARFYEKDFSRALEDMRKAGELGIIDAYSIIKRMTE